MQQKLDGWIERWVAVEYNAQMLESIWIRFLVTFPDPTEQTRADIGGGGKGLGKKLLKEQIALNQKLR